MPRWWNKGLQAYVEPAKRSEYKYQGDLPCPKFSLFAEIDPNSEKITEEEGNDSGDDGESGDDQEPDIEAIDYNTKVEGERRTKKIHDKKRKVVSKPFAGGSAQQQ